VFNFCTRQNTEDLVGQRLAREPGSSISGADFVGAELYDRLKIYIAEHVRGLIHVRNSLLILIRFRSLMV
jgi:hypothetical protein